MEDVSEGFVYTYESHKCVLQRHAANRNTRVPSEFTHHRPNAPSREHQPTSSLRQATQRELRCTRLLPSSNQHRPPARTMKWATSFLRRAATQFRAQKTMPPPPPHQRSVCAQHFLEALGTLHTISKALLVLLLIHTPRQHALHRRLPQKLAKAQPGIHSEETEG